MIALLATVALALPDVVEHPAPVNVVVCDGAPYNRAIVARAMRWWQERCVFDEIGFIVRGECGPYPEHGKPFMAPANTIFLTADQPPMPWQAAATETLFSPAGPISLIRFDAAHARRWRPIGFSVRWRMLLHELGHALAFDHAVWHHSAPGTVMAPGLDTMGPSDEGLNQCSP